MDTFTTFTQMMVTQSNRDHFIDLNTSTLPIYEQVDPGYELVDGLPIYDDTEWVKVFAIRYGGMSGDNPNRWGL